MWSVRGILCVVVFFIVCVPHVTGSAYGEKIENDFYEISREKINRTIEQGTIFEDSIEIFNKRDTALEVFFSVSESMTPFITLNVSGIVVEPKQTGELLFNIVGYGVGNATGKLTLSNDINEEVEIILVVTNESLDAPFLVDVFAGEEKNTINNPFLVKTEISKIDSKEVINVSLIYTLISPEGQATVLEEKNVTLENSIQFLKFYDFPENASEGLYEVSVQAKYNGRNMIARDSFEGTIALLYWELFGVFPLWLLVLIILIILLILLAAFLIRRHIRSKKKYKMFLDMKTLPKENKESLFLGKIAERKEKAYLEPNRLTTHSIVAGATGGGKSISAQVIIEEALKQNISVIVFDPTAQWSGMLRKGTDKKMIDLFPKFGLRPADARGFPGNIRPVKNARQIIDVSKYAQPGQIQIFPLNNLDPKDMDIFVANIIRQIFKSDPKESPTLKTLIVFDEVHRLLSKFGGSGEGFLQIERGCREFRKWGIGIMLISQVLSDFMGEIKANISTEVQMRTRDEGDLNRIKTKYGENFLQSLVKASVGVGMFSNPAYNHANPYFVQFRPILHNTRRLPDEELEKYNTYNEQVDQLEYEIEQLEELKVDVFDLKMELKLVKDKIMVGNFSVVDIYLEGLKPRMQKQWEKLGKQPKKLEIQLADLAEIKKSIEEAKKGRKEAEEKEAAKEKEQAKESAPSKEETFETKVVKPLIFDNGIMVSSLKELKEILPGLDDEIFKIHVNENKNDIAEWLKQIDPATAPRLISIKDKQELITELGTLGTTRKAKPQPATGADAKKAQKQSVKGQAQVKTGPQANDAQEESGKDAAPKQEQGKEAEEDAQEKQQT